MDARGPRGHEQGRPDLVVGHPRHHQLQDLVLTHGEGAGAGRAGLLVSGQPEPRAPSQRPYVLGQGAKIYLRQGCQWGPRGIKTVVQQIVSQAKTDSVIDRLKHDLKKRIGV